MADLGNRANVNSAIDLLLDDLQPDEAIQPSDHNVLLKDILDTLANGLSTVLRTGNTTDGENLTITSSSIFQFSNGSNGRLQSDTLTAFRNWTLPDTTGTIALLSDIPSSDNIYTADGTIGTGRVATITDALSFRESNGVHNVFKIFESGDVLFNNGGGVINSKFFANGKVALGGSTIISSVAGITLHRNTSIKAESISQNVLNILNPSSSGIFQVKGNGNCIIAGNSFVSTEDISLQGSTLIKGIGTAGSSALTIYDNDTTPNKLWDFLDNGKLNASNLPTISTGTVVGDVWSQNGTVKIGNPSANITTVASVGGLTVNADTTEVAKVLALATNITINAPTGTPNDNQSLWFRILDNGTSRTITLNAVFEDYTGNFPTSTTAGKYLIFAGKWNADEGKWNILAWKVQP